MFYMNGRVRRKTLFVKCALPCFWISVLAGISPRSVEAFTGGDFEPPGYKDPKATPTSAPTNATSGYSGNTSNIGFTDRFGYYSNNGITVGKLKVFDEYSLLNMLMAAEEQLRPLNFTDRTQVAGRIGMVQGSTATTNATSAQLLTLPSPSLKTTHKLTAPSTQTKIEDVEKSKTIDKDGTANDQTDAENGTTTTVTKTDESSSVERVRERAALTPTIPSTAGAVGLAVGQVGLSSQDTLEEQVRLNYQVMNLRLLLDRALSDRAFGRLGSRSPRLTATTGFQVSVMPPTNLKNVVADVEITVYNRNWRHNHNKGVDGSPSIVAILPREKTYNVVHVSRKSTRLGIGIVEALNFGAENTRTNDRLFIHRDTDTVAFERDTPLNPLARNHDMKSGSVTFGWQFRPVLDRPVVEPGLRQVFSMLAMADQEKPSLGTPYSENQILIHTCWREYNPKTGAVGKVISGTATWYDAGTLRSGSTEDEHRSMTPTLRNLRWSDAGNGNILATADGDFLYPGTSIFLGDQPLPPQMDLTIRNEHHVSFRAPANLLLASTPTIMGRFGSQQEIFNSGPAHGIANCVIDLQAAGDGIARVTADIVYEGAIDYNRDRPLALIGDAVYGLNDSAATYEWDSTTNKLTFSFLVKTSRILEFPKVLIKHPFAQNSPSKRVQIEQILEVSDLTPFGAEEINLLSSENDGKMLSIRGIGFDEDLRVTIKGTDFCDTMATKGDSCTVDTDVVDIKDPSLLLVNLDKAKATGLQKIILYKTSVPGYVATLSVPSTAKIKTPRFISHPDIPHNSDLIPTKITGGNFDSIVKVTTTDNTIVEHKVEDDGTTLILRLPRKVTVAEAPIQLTFLLKDGTIHHKEFTIGPQKGTSPATR